MTVDELALVAAQKATATAGQRGHLRSAPVPLDVLRAAITAYLSARSAEPNMWGVRVPTSRQEATAMQIVAERWLAENSGPAARSAEPVAAGEARTGPIPVAVVLAAEAKFRAHPTPEASDV